MTRPLQLSSQLFLSYMLLRQFGVDHLRGQARGPVNEASFAALDRRLNWHTARRPSVLEPMTDFSTDMDEDWEPYLPTPVRVLSVGHPTLDSMSVPLEVRYLPRAGEPVRPRSTMIRRNLWRLGDPPPAVIAQLGIEVTEMKPLKERALALMATFEGSAGGRINVWDEQYLSLGTLHFAVKAGPGARFLMRVQALDPAGYLRCLGDGMAVATRQGQAALTEYCRTQVWNQPGRWNTPFRLLSLLPAFRAADAEAAQPFLASAERVAKRYDLTSERGYAFALDRCVQQGAGIRPGVEAAFAQSKLAYPTGPEYNVMKMLAQAFADSANPKYRDVVLKRSLTVALGSTQASGYPAHFNLEADYDLSPNRSWGGQV